MHYKEHTAHKNNTKLLLNKQINDNPKLFTKRLAKNVKN